MMIQDLNKYAVIIKKDLMGVVERLYNVAFQH